MSVAIDVLKSKPMVLISAPELEAAELPEPPKEIIGRGQIAIISAQFGRGKTPLLMQAALAAASGQNLTPLGTHSCQGAVIGVDFETDPAVYRQNLRRICHAFKITSPPPALKLWFALGDELTPGKANMETLRRIVADHQPGYLTIDPLRLFTSGYELQKVSEAEGVIRHIRNLRREAPDIRIVISNHLRKQDLMGPKVSLSNDPFDWMMRVSGSLALLDHVDVRLGMEEESGKLILGGIKRGVGVVGPWSFEPILDDKDEPSGYQFDDCKAVLSHNHQKLWQRLPEEFTWGQAKTTLGIAESSLKRLLDAAKPLYERTQDDAYKKLEV